MLRPIVNIVDGPLRDTGKEPQTILVLEYWYLGDLAMLTPFLKNLRLHYPAAHVALLASPRVLPLLEGQRLVDEVIAVNVPWTQHMSRWKKYLSRHWVEFFRCVRALRARRFDWGFAGRGDIRENVILWLAGVKRRVGYGFGYGGSLLTDIATPDLERPHHIDRWLRLLEHIGKPVLDRRPELKVMPEEKREAWRLLKSFGLNKDDILVGVHAGARNPVRQWGEQNFFEVAEKLAASYPVKILWFHEPGSPNPPSRSGLIPVALPLRQFLAVVSECRLLVCNDTGPMHLASAVGVPVVAVFGPGMSAWWGPQSAGSRVVVHEGVWCRPCLDYCIFDQPYCLRAISVDKVLKASIEVLQHITSKISIEGYSRTDMSVLETADQKLREASSGR